MNLSVLRGQLRGYVCREFKTLVDYKIVYQKPVKLRMWNPKKTGDRGLDLDVKQTDIAPKYQVSQTLKEIDNELVKRKFTLEWQPKKQFRNMRKHLATELVQRHEYDSGSTEAQIASMTADIQYLEKFVTADPHKVNTRVYLKHLVDRRKRRLKFLREWDYRRFEWILEKLNLEYRPPPVGPRIVTRKNTLRMMTQDLCDKIVNSKLDAYRKELESQLEHFYANKADTLEFIMKEEAELGLPPTVTKEQVEEARAAAEVATQKRKASTVKEKEKIV